MHGPSIQPALGAATITPARTSSDGSPSKLQLWRLRTIGIRSRRSSRRIRISGALRWDQIANGTYNTQDEAGRGFIFWGPSPATGKVSIAARARPGTSPEISRSSKSDELQEAYRPRSPI